PILYRDLPSFPTRRSSDLGGNGVAAVLSELQQLLEHCRPNDGCADGRNAGCPERRRGARPGHSVVLGVLDAGGAAPIHVVHSRLDRKSTRLNSSHEWISYA